MLRNAARLAAGLLAAGAVFASPLGVAASSGAGPAGSGQDDSADARAAVVTALLQSDTRMFSLVTNPVDGRPMYHPVNPDGSGV
jgi:hypothetical protein